MNEPAAPNSQRELSEEDRARLERAHRALTEAVAAYQRRLGRELEPGQPGRVAEAEQMRTAREAVEAAERHLWQLREDLLGWTRPPWAPSAALTADWFSEEDAVYDDVPEPTVS